MNPLKSVLLVDDHAVVREGYRLLLEKSGNFRVIGEADSGEKAVATYPALKPDLVIMDLNLPQMSGIETIRAIRGIDPDAKILAFSIHPESIYAQRTLDAGASGYLCKNSSPQDMIDRASRLAFGILATGDDPPSRQRADRSLSGNLTASLSAREFEVFQLLGKGHDSREIAKIMDLTPKTISNYTVLIKEKLYLGTTAELIHLATQYLTSDLSKISLTQSQGKPSR